MNNNGDVMLFSTDAKSCFNTTCKNSDIYYGETDKVRVSAYGTREIDSCFAYFFKRPTEAKKQTKDYNTINENISPDWGDCNQYDTYYKTQELGFRAPNGNMMENNDFMQVGLASCHKQQLEDKWCTDCKGKFHVISFS